MGEHDVGRGQELAQACGTKVKKEAEQKGAEPERVRTMVEPNGMKRLVKPKGWREEVELEG